MTDFLDGPAAGITLTLRRAPTLRPDGRKRCRMCAMRKHK